MLHILYGRENQNAYRACFSHIKEADVQQHHYVLVPNQFTHEAEEAAVEALGGQGLMDTEILSFARLGHRILGETGGNTRVALAEGGRSMVLARILREHESELTAFRRMSRSPSFAAQMDSLLSEMKQYGTTPEQMAEAAKEAGETSLLGRKLLDASRVFQLYQDEIAGKYCDAEDYTDFFIQQAERCAFVRQGTFWLLGFDPFPPKTAAFFDVLCRQARDVTIVLTLCETGDADEDLFGLSRAFLSSLCKRAEAMGVSYEVKPLEGAETEPRTEALAYLERALFADSASPYEQPAPEITTLVAPNVHSEAETAAAEILTLVRDKGYRYRDIAVLINDMENRGALARRVFATYGIPVFMDQKRTILSNPAVRYVLSLLAIVSRKYQTADVFAWIKTDLSPLPEEGRELLENYAKAYHIKGKRWKTPFAYGINEYGQQMDQLEAWRQLVAAPLESFEDAFCKAKTAAQKTRELYRFLAEEVRLPEQLEKLRAALLEQKQLDEAQEIAQVWDALMAQLDQLVQLFGESELTDSEYEALLTAGMASCEVGLIPSAADQVLIGPARRLATGPIKALFVLGAEEGVLPAESESRDLLSQGERDTLLTLQADFCRANGWIVQEEVLALYRDLAKPAERLWISGTNANEAGEPQQLAGVFHRVETLFPKRTVARSVEHRETVWGMVQTPDSTLPYLAQHVSRQGLKGDQREEWQQVYNWYLQQRTDAFEAVQQGLLANPGQEHIDPKRANDLYPPVISPSRVETFARCPFKHFVSYGLRPKEERPFESDKRSLGDVYHLCLMELSKRLSADLNGKAVTDPSSLWMTLSEIDLEQLCRAILEEVAASLQEGLLNEEDGEEQYRKSRVENVFLATAKALVAQVRAGQIDRMYLEEPFGSAGAVFPAIPVKTSKGTVYIEGKIDRVDLLPGRYVKIIDYKSGSDTFAPEEARTGYRLQLMLYLIAGLQDEKQKEENGADLQPHKKPAGVFYFHIRDPFAASEKDLRELFAMQGIVVKDDSVINTIESSDDDHVMQGVSHKKDGELKETNGVIEAADFKSLIDDVNAKACELAEALYGGDAKARPMRRNQASACQYCTYRSICTFEEAFASCTYEDV